MAWKQDVLAIIIFTSGFTGKTIKVSDNNLKKIRSINERMNDIYKKIWDLDCEINRLTTRINLLKSKIR